MLLEIKNIILTEKLSDQIDDVSEHNEFFFSGLESV